MMASTSKPSLQLLSRVFTRRRIAQHATHNCGRRFSSLDTHSRTNQFSSAAPSSSSSWPQRHCQHQRRYLTEPANNSASVSKQADEYPLSRASESAKSSNKKPTLLSNIQYVLKKIRVGRMSDSKLAEARAFLSIVSKWHNVQGATLAEALLERLYKEQTIGGNTDVIIDSEMYNICMDAWNKSNVGGEQIVHHVESIISRMEERYFRCGDDGGKDLHPYMARPDKISYNLLINAYSKWDSDSSNKIEGILEKMIAFANDAASSDNDMDRDYEALIRPDEVTYNSLMNYYATRKNQHLSAQRAEDLLLQMSGQGGSIQMNTLSFNIVLKAWGNSGGGIHGAQRAESVLRMMMKLYSQGHENVRPDALSFSTVMNAYSKVDPEDASIALEKVMQLLDELEGSFISDSDTNINSCYNAAANAIVKNGVENAVNKIEELMKRMKNMDGIPDGSMYASFIEAYTNEGGDDSFARGKELLMEMMDGVGPRDQRDLIVPFNIVLDSILKGKSTNNLEQAEELMSLMENVGGNARPDLKSYSMIISALSRNPAKDSEQKAVEYLRKMLKSYRDGYVHAKPNSFVFNCIISMLARSTQESDDVIYRTLMAMENQQKRGNTSVIPDTITYNLVIGKLARSGTKNNAKKVMTLLTSMEESSHEAIAPDIITYTNVLKIQEKVNPLRAAYIASSCLQRVMSKDKKMQVDRLGFQSLLLALSRSYKLEHAMMSRKAWEWMEKSDRANDRDMLESGLCNLVLIGYSKTDDPNAAEGALSFLSERIRRHNEGDKTAVLPTVIGFSAAMVSLSKANRIDDALRLWEIMRVLSRDGMPNVKPDDGCWASMLGPLTRSRAENAPSQALRVVRRMREVSEEIPTASLNTAINACSRASGSPIARRKALEIAFEILQLGRESESCDAITFGLMIKTCIKLTDDDHTRFKLVEPLFKLCAKSGLVGNMVIREIEPLKKRLLEHDHLPREWTINAKDK